MSAFHRRKLPMNRAIPLKSLAPNELAIAGKAFDDAMARVSMSTLRA
jgi:hypothetical protein